MTRETCATPGKQASGSSGIVGEIADFELEPMKLIDGPLHWVLPVPRQERGVALWAAAYFFMLLAGYYVLRPLRDQLGIAGGVKTLPWMFTASFLSLLILQPLYGLLVKKLPRRRFIAVVYQFFAVNLLIFWLLLHFDVATVWVARVFFVWVTVFNLFTVALFWSLMADLFTSEQGKRLFGFIGAGGTAGALFGPAITVGLSVPFGPANLLLVAAVFLELALFLCVSLGAIDRGRGRHLQRRAAHRRQYFLGPPGAAALSLPDGYRGVGEPHVLWRHHALPRAGTSGGRTSAWGPARRRGCLPAWT